MSLSRAEVNLDALDYNYNKIRSLLPSKTKIIAVVKADGYGCGAVDCMKALEKYSDDWYAVANINEAIVLRENGSVKPILILGYTKPEFVSLIYKYKLTQTIVSTDYAKALEQALNSSVISIDVHIKLDTGMSRIGLLCYEEYFNQALYDTECILLSKNFNVTGVFTHISTLYELDKKSKKFAETQYLRYLKFINTLKEKGYDLGLCHCSNSAGIINMPELNKLDAVRPGTALFGIVPEKCKIKPLEFKEVISIKTTVINVKKIKKDSYFSYSMSAKSCYDMTVATLAVGYGDGYRRGLSNKGNVLINGIKCPVLGRVCMDMIIVDIGCAGNVNAGDEAVLIGKMENQEIKAEEVSAILETGPSEIYSLFTKRLPRLYIKNGNPIYYVNYDRNVIEIS